jgi:hypothetical protein
MELRNNLIIVERYLPKEMRTIYRHDWLQRYAALGMHDGHRDAVNSAVREARVWARREMEMGRRVVNASALEAVFQWNAQVKAVAAWSSANSIRRVAIADVSKNIYATWRACRQAGLEIAAVLENAPAFAGATYRGVPIIADAGAASVQLDGIVLSTVNPAQVDGRLNALASEFKGPLLRLWEPKVLGTGTARPPRGAGDPNFTPNQSEAA